MSIAYELDAQDLPGAVLAVTVGAPGVILPEPCQFWWEMYRLYLQDRLADAIMHALPYGAPLTVDVTAAPHPLARAQAVITPDEQGAAEDPLTRLACHEALDLALTVVSDPGVRWEAHRWARRGADNAHREVECDGETARPRTGAGK